MFILYKETKFENIKSQQTPISKILGCVNDESSLLGYANFLVEKFNYKIGTQTPTYIQMLDKNEVEEFLCIKKVVNINTPIKTENNKKAKKSLLLRDNEHLDAIINYINTNNDFFKKHADGKIDSDEYSKFKAKQDIESNKITDREK